MKLFLSDFLDIFTLKSRVNKSLFWYTSIYDLSTNVNSDYIVRFDEKT
jgi:hypothetical protein